MTLQWNGSILPASDAVAIVTETVRLVIVSASSGSTAAAISAQECLERWETADDNGDGDFEYTPKGEEEGVVTCCGGDLDRTDDGENDNDGTEREDASKTELLTGVDLNLPEEHKWHSHNC